MYIGRKQLGDELAVGKIIKGSNQATLNTTKDGVGTQHAEFQILTYNPSKKTIDNSATTPPSKCAPSSIVVNFFNI